MIDMAVQGSGTQADPYTKITGMGFQWLDVQPATTYVAIGTDIDIRDDAYELSDSDPRLPAYGLAYDRSLGYWSLHGTVSANAGDTLHIELDNGEEVWQSCTLVFVSSGPTVEGSGTQADPWTRWEGTAWQFWDAVVDGRTYYASIGAYFDVTDYDPRESGEEDYFVIKVQPNGTLGLSIVKYGLSGTATSSGKVTVRLVWGLEGHEEYKEIYIQLGSGPTLNVKVNGAWKEGKPFVKVNGAWKEATKVFVKVNGAWKESQ